MKPICGEATESDCHLERFCDLLQLHIDSDSNENHSAVSEPIFPLAYNNDVDDGEEGWE